MIKIKISMNCVCKECKNDTEAMTTPKFFCWIMTQSVSFYWVMMLGGVYWRVGGRWDGRKVSKFSTGGGGTPPPSPHSHSRENPVRFTIDLPFWATRRLECVSLALINYIFFQRQAIKKLFGINKQVWVAQKIYQANKAKCLFPTCQNFRPANLAKSQTRRFKQQKSLKNVEVQ